MFMSDQERHIRKKSTIYQTCSKSYLLYNFCCFVLVCSVPPMDPAGNCSFWTRQDGRRDLGEQERERVKEGQGRPKTRSRKPEPNIRKILEERSVPLRQMPLGVSTDIDLCVSGARWQEPCYWNHAFAILIKEQPPSTWLWHDNRGSTTVSWSRVEVRSPFTAAALNHYNES